MSPIVSTLVFLASAITLTIGFAMFLEFRTFKMEVKPPPSNA